MCTAKRKELQRLAHVQVLSRTTFDERHKTWHNLCCIGGRAISMDPKPLQSIACPVFGDTPLTRVSTPQQERRRGAHLVR